MYLIYTILSISYNFFDQIFLKYSVYVTNFMSQLRIIYLYIPYHKYHINMLYPIYSVKDCAHGSLISLSILA